MKLNFYIVSLIFSLVQKFCNLQNLSDFPLCYFLKLQELLYCFMIFFSNFLTVIQASGILSGFGILLL